MFEIPKGIARPEDAGSRESNEGFEHRTAEKMVTEIRNYFELHPARKDEWDNVRDLKIPGEQADLREHLIHDIIHEKVNTPYGHDKPNINVKIGSEGWLREQFMPGGQIEREIEKSARKTFIFVSKEFNDLPVSMQQNITGRMREIGGDVIVGLPRVNEIDNCIDRAAQGLKDRPRKDGPQDQQFDRDKDKWLEEQNFKTYPESSFGKGEDGVQGRKPTPDAVSDDGKTKIYWEDKRPSECESKNWLSTYPNDPIKEPRTKARDDLDNGKISRPEAEAKTIIAEHDDHYTKRGSRWSDPEGLRDESRNEKLGIRLPDSPNNQELIKATEQELKDQGRNPDVRRENGIVYITYDTPPRADTKAT
mgnify:CR=1 FL=1